MLWLSVGVFTGVHLFLFLGLFRHRSVAPDSPAADRRLNTAVGAAVAVTIIILLSLLAASIWIGKAITPVHASNAVTIAVVGHQWWWEIEYENSDPSRRVTTANDFHVPVGSPIVFKVTSRDVIHSLWIPNINGKRDLIPGYTTAIWTQVDSPGIYRGQCAEFCGRQHAHMAFAVVAEARERFEQWLEAMRRPAQEPQNPAALRGRDVFMANRCAGCHRIRGTSAGGTVAPDLTHVGSRLTLGAGTLPNTREHLSDWITDAQSSKPGNQMPPNPLGSDDLDALLTYLEALR
jgi:cytochrome c oxidase subunit 2